MINYQIPVEEFPGIVNAVCPHCRAGNPVRKRADTSEYVHDDLPGHSICWATGLRNSTYAPEETNG